MKYKIDGTVIPHDVRADINTKVLTCVLNNDTSLITEEDMFNAYTGIGGLHGLKRGEYANYHAYGQAKKEIENGQFFTPHQIAKQVSELVTPKESDLVVDLTCGMGNFFNYFTERNCYGCELESDAARVAKFLYPDAHIEQKNLSVYRPDVRFDYCIGNPPFNTKINGLLSQTYYFQKAHEYLQFGGICLAIVPESYLADVFFDKTAIETMNRMFSFLGQISLSDDAFAAIGVKVFKTKVIALQKRFDAENGTDYTNEFTTWEGLKESIQKAERSKHENRLKAKQKMATEYGSDFMYKVNKYMYELRTHATLATQLVGATTYMNRFENQSCPKDMEYTEWFKKHRITENMVLSYLKRAVSKQNRPNKQQKEAKRLRVLRQNNYRAQARKTACFGQHAKPIDQMSLNVDISEYLGQYRFFDNDGIEHGLSDMQKKDVNRICQRRYSILAWQQGCGKTIAANAWIEYENRQAFIVSASLAINTTWKMYMERNNKKYLIVKSLEDINRMRDYDYVLLSFHYIGRFKKQLIRYVNRIKHNNISFVFDESDEITNNTSKKTRNVLAVFRRAYRKLLATGTTTRNNILDLYTQLELLYNNSQNMLCDVSHYYVEDRKEKQLKREENKYYGKPFHPRFGHTTFKRCFSPSKTTVFGVQQHNQNVYNETELRSIIKRTIITRKFSELVGEKHTVHNVTVKQNFSERDVYSRIVHELNEIIPTVYKSTGDSRKDNMLRIIRQLNLLIEATSTPNLFKFYTGEDTTTKFERIARMVEGFEGTCAIGCTTLKAVQWYTKKLRSLGRPLFVVTGADSFDKRMNILSEFEQSGNGVLVCTQQALKSSVNVPTCDNVIVESMQWNIPRIEQFYFRFIRFNSKNNTDVYFVNYENTIEINLLGLLMAKERMNEYVKTLDSDTDIFERFGIDESTLQSALTKTKDENGNMQLNWGNTNF